MTFEDEEPSRLIFSTDLIFFSLQVTRTLRDYIFHFSASFFKSKRCLGEKVYAAVIDDDLFGAMSDRQTTSEFNLIKEERRNLSRRLFEKGKERAIEQMRKLSGID